MLHGFVPGSVRCERFASQAVCFPLTNVLGYGATFVGAPQLRASVLWCGTKLSLFVPLVFVVISYNAGCACACFRRCQGFCLVRAVKVHSTVGSRSVLRSLLRPCVGFEIVLSRRGLSRAQCVVVTGAPPCCMA